MSKKIKETNRWLETVAKMRATDVDAKRQSWKNPFLSNAFHAAYQKVNRGMVAAFKLYKHDVSSQRTRSFVEKKMMFSPELYDETLRPTLQDSLTSQYDAQKEEKEEKVEKREKEAIKKTKKETIHSLSVPERSRDFSRPFDYFSGVFSVTTLETQQAQKFKVSREINRSITNIVESAREFSAILRYEKSEQEDIFGSTTEKDKNQLNR